jgi:hypothetical protein
MHEVVATGRCGLRFRFQKRKLCRLFEGCRQEFSELDRGGLSQGLCVVTEVLLPAVVTALTDEIESLRVGSTARSMPPAQPAQSLELGLPTGSRAAATLSDRADLRRFEFIDQFLFAGFKELQRNCDCLPSPILMRRICL